MKETLEEAAEKYWAKQPYNEDAFMEGAKWQQEQDKKRYSEEEVLTILQEFKRYLSFGDEVSQAEWFEQFKKK